MNGVPPIPATCANRPTVGGLVVPYVNSRLADGGVDFRTPNQTRYDLCLKHHLCQTCGNKLGRPAVLFGGPNQLARRRFDEPPLCAPCAAYASRACPMVAGRQPRYATGTKLVDGPRGQACPDGCGCGGHTATDPNTADSRGAPAHPWYALYVAPGDWVTTAHEVQRPCTDLGCLHTVTVVNGGLLTGNPSKVMLVSAPGEGRVWRRLAPDEVTALIPPLADVDPRVSR